MVRRAIGGVGGGPGGGIRLYLRNNRQLFAATGFCATIKRRVGEGAAVMGNHSSSVHVLSAAALAALLAACGGSQPVQDESAPPSSAPSTAPATMPGESST